MGQFHQPIGAKSKYASVESLAESLCPTLPVHTAWSYAKLLRLRSAAYASN